jgi:O-antigen/teichoic acid export membrane protein
LRTLQVKIHDYYQELFRSSEFRKGLIKVYGGDIFSTFIGAVTALLIIRGLAVNDYASYTAFYSIVTLFPLLIGNGVNSALIRFSAEHISKTGQKPLELYLISFILQLSVYLLLGFFLLIFSDGVTNVIFGQKAFDDALRYGLIAGVGILISQAGRGVYNAEERFGSYIKALWLRQILIFSSIAVFFLFKQLSFQRTALIMIIAELSIATIVFCHIFRGARISRIVTALKEKRGLIEEFLSSTGWLIAYFFIVIAFQKFDVFMLSHFSSEEELANYGVAFRYYSLAMIVLASLNAVMLPKFSKAEMQDLGRQRQFTVKWLKATVWLVIPLVVFDLFGNPLFTWLNGMRYENAFYIFVILSSGFWINLMFSPLVHIVMARKAYKFLFFLGLAAFSLNLLGNYNVVPRWGGLGAAFVTVASHGLINITAFFRVLLSTK